MYFQKLFFITFLIFSIFLIGSCGTSEAPTKTPANNETAKNNANSVNSPTNKSVNPLETSKTPEAVTVNQGQTIAPVVQAYYEALKKKDEATVKKFLSQDSLKYWETEAKAEKKSWFAYLLELEEPLNEKREVRNEKIDGNIAIAELKGGSLGVWTKIQFVKENGEWKFDSPEKSFSLEEINKNPANSAK